MFGMLPTEYASKDVKTRLQKLSGMLDSLLFLDGSAELSVDRRGFMAIAADPELVPQHLSDIFILETAKHLGRRLKDVGNGHRVTWAESSKYNELNKSGISELKKLGLNRSMSTKEVVAVLSKWHPELTKDFLNRDSADVNKTILANLDKNRTVWDCVVANLGWWAAINVIGTIIIALVMLGSAVPWPWVLAAIVAFTAFFTAFVILSCAANPEWSF